LLQIVSRVLGITTLIFFLVIVGILIERHVVHMIIEIFLIFFLLKKPFLLLTSVRILIKLQVLMVHGRILVEHFSCIHDRLLALSLIIILPHLGSILLLVLIVLVQIHDQMLSIKHRALVVVHHMTLPADVAMLLLLVLQLFLSHSV